MLQEDAATWVSGIVQCMIPIEHLFGIHRLKPLSKMCNQQAAFSTACPKFTSKQSLAYLRVQKLNCHFPILTFLTGCILVYSLFIIARSTVCQTIWLQLGPSDNSPLQNSRKLCSGVTFWKQKLSCPFTYCIINLCTPCSSLPGTQCTRQYDCSWDQVITAHCKIPRVLL